jgi:hypothetical protein
VEQDFKPRGSRREVGRKSDLNIFAQEAETSRSAIIDEPGLATGAAWNKLLQPTHRDLRQTSHQACSHAISTLPQLRRKTQGIYQDYL